MKKIMFNDNYCLTQAVMEGRKTMTRRIVPDGTPLGNWEETARRLRYKHGEVVAVAQSYESIHDEMMTGDYGDSIYDAFRWAYVADSHGWRNKMFVRADIMPHQIRITNVRIERLQDISDEECLKEGIYKDNPRPGFYFNGYAFDLSQNQYGNVLATEWFKTPREAFAALIDKVSGKGTWESNPWVSVYEFELLK